jgi:hypothetical protein
MNSCEFSIQCNEYEQAKEEGTYLLSQGFELGIELGFELGIRAGNSSSEFELGF